MANYDEWDAGKYYIETGPDPVGSNKMLDYLKGSLHKLTKKF